MGSQNSLGLVLIRTENSDAPKLLLIRTANAPRDWALPLVPASGQAYAYLNELQSALFPNAVFERLEDLSKSFDLREGATTVHVLKVSQGELPAYLEADSVLEARWASFDEAFHVARLDLEPVIRWAERQTQKHLHRA